RVRVVADDDVAVRAKIQPASHGFDSHPDLVKTLLAGIAIIVKGIRTKNAIHAGRVITVADAVASTQEDVITMTKDVMIPENAVKRDGIAFRAGAVGGDFLVVRRNGVAIVRVMAEDETAETEEKIPLILEPWDEILQGEQFLIDPERIVISKLGAEPGPDALQRLIIFSWQNNFRISGNGFRASGSGGESG